MAKAIKISDEDYKRLTKLAKLQKRTIQGQISIVLDYFFRMTKRKN